MVCDRHNGALASILGYLFANDYHQGLDKFP